MKTSVEMKKRQRGFYEFAQSQQENIVILRWVDNSLVNVASNCHGSQHTKNVLRYSQAEKKNIHITRPHVVGGYNKYMGGTDRMDENVAKQRIGIRSKKWWWPLFTWLLDVSIHNS